MQVEGISKNRVEEDDEVELLDHEDLTIATPLSHMQDVTENIQNLDAVGSSKIPSNHKITYRMLQNRSKIHWLQLLKTR